MTKTFWMISAILLIPVLAQSAKSDENAAQIHRLALKTDADTDRVILDRTSKPLAAAETACVDRQKEVMASLGSKGSPSALPADMKVSYEVIASESKSLDDPQMLLNPAVTGPLKGVVDYGKGLKTLHVPVIVLSDGSCVPYGPDRVLQALNKKSLELEIKSKGAVRTAKR